MLGLQFYYNRVIIIEIAAFTKLTNLKAEAISLLPGQKRLYKLYNGLENLSVAKWFKHVFVKDLTALSSSSIMQKTKYNCSVKLRKCFFFKQTESMNIVSFIYLIQFKVKIMSLESNAN